MIKNIISTIKGKLKRKAPVDDGKLIKPQHREIIEWYAGQDTHVGILARSVLRGETQRGIALRDRLTKNN